MTRIVPFQENTIVVGDCLDIMAQMPDGCVDLIVADYPFGFSDNAWDLSGNDAWELMKDTVPEFKRIIRTNGSLYLFSGMYLVADLRIYCRDVRLNLVNWLVWRFDLGYHPRTKYKNRSYHILYLGKGQPDIFNGDDIRIPSLSDPRHNPKGKIPSDVWLISEPRKNSKEYRNHKGQKPEALIERIIKASSNLGDLTFAPFMGSGTTAVVADRLGRKFFGCDINPDYVKGSLERLNEN